MALLKEALSACSQESNMSKSQITLSQMSPPQAAISERKGERKKTLQDL
jgi:hypothetical protein